VPAGAGIVLQADELDDYQFSPPANLADLLAPAGLRRTLAALAVTDGRGASYLPQQLS
jgi:hypothetical protein